MCEQTPALNAALAQLQADLPQVAKGETAEVTGLTKAGQPFKYSYNYADLADVSRALLPRLARLGMAWCTRPTIKDGKFVLLYELLHAQSGELKGGEYPLTGTTPQEMGSAITYARRYTLLAVTGLAPAGDDDDGAAASRSRERWEDAQPRRDTQTTDASGFVMDNPRVAELIADMFKTDATGLRGVWERVRDAHMAGAINDQALAWLNAHIKKRKAEFDEAAESTAEPEQSGGLSDRTRSRLFALFGDVGMGGEEHQQARRDFATATIESRVVESMATVTEAEAKKLITALLDRKKELGVTP